MTGPTDTEFQINLEPIAGAKFAYTLNYDQHVKCTYISGQPFFFMNEEEVPEDDGLFEKLLGEDDENLLDLVLNELNGKINAYETLAKDFRKEDDFAAIAFAENADDITSYEAPIKSIKDLTAYASQSRLMLTLINFLEDKDIAIEYGQYVEYSEYDRTNKTILINPFLSLEHRVLLLAKEMRRAWQHKNGTLVDPMALYPDHGILVNRLQTADLNVFMVRSAWELQLAGAKEIWSYIENSAFSDLARGFAREACSDFRSLNNGNSSLSVLESWFLSERCRREDRKLIQRMLAEKDKSYQMEQEASAAATMSIIAKLGEMPYGKNYLSGHAHFIMGDPIFSEIRDRSNANFLWFVKFESSFEQAEHILQSDKDKNEASASDANKNKGRDSYAQESTGEILAFPTKYAGSHHIKGKKHDTTDADLADILPFEPQKIS